MIQTYQVWFRRAAIAVLGATERASRRRAPALAAARQTARGVTTGDGASPSPVTLASFHELNARRPRWRRLEVALLATLFLVALVLRFARLDAAGLADDEVQKWLAAGRYLHGDFGGDDLEHPMLFKSLIAIGRYLLPRLPLETLTRWPAAAAGALTVLAVALLGRRLFGRATALLAAALLAISSVAIGYHRVGKEDALLGLFLTLHLWCIAEAAAAASGRRERAQSRWELGAAAALGAMLASKYFVFLAPTGLLAYAWLRRASAWRVSLPRFLGLAAAAGAIFAVLNWAVFLPSTWSYLRSYSAGDKITTPSLFYAGHYYLNLPLAWRDGVPPGFYAEFALAKLTPPVLAAALLGVGISLWRRTADERVLLAWLLVWCAALIPAGAKYGRYTVSLFPAVALLAAHGIVQLAHVPLRFANFTIVSRRAALALLSGLALAAEAGATAATAPYYRHYISPLAGGEAALTNLFPHCDLWDEGAREAAARLARDARAGDEVASDIEAPLKLYLERAGRTDLRLEPLRRDAACSGRGACWLVTQPGRRYLHNREALDRLAQRTAAFAITMGGTEVVRVFRLEPWERAFPESPSMASRDMIQ